MAEEENTLGVCYPFARFCMSIAMPIDCNQKKGFKVAKLRRHLEGPWIVGQKVSYTESKVVLQKYMITHVIIKETMQVL